MYKLYIGNEPYISRKQALRVISTLKQTTPEYISIDVEKVDPSSIIDTISSQNLFSTQRVIFLKRIYKNKKKDEIINFLLEYLPNIKTDHIIIWEDQKVSSVTKYVKFFKNNKLLEEYNKLNKRTFFTYAKEILTELEITLDSNSTRLLAEYSNYNPERFENNLKKLKLLGKEKITEEDIKELAPNTLEDDIWKLLDEINNGNTNSINMLEKILKQGIDPNYILAMLARNLRLLAMTKSMKEKGASSSDIASVLRVPPFTVPSLIKASERYTHEKINLIYEKLSSLDYEIKIGRIDPALGITLFSTIL